MQRPTTYSDALLALRNSLHQLAQWGCRGFDVSEQGIAALEQWTGPAVAMEQPPVTEEPPASLSALEVALNDCRRCALGANRTSVVFGQGDPHADLLIVGPFPGEKDNQTGLALTGPAGELFDRILAAMKLDRKKVYICHAVKCLPADPSGPDPSETRTCLPYLARQIAMIQPKVICTLGEFAAQTLLDTTTPLTQLRGRFHDYHGIRVMPTLHPADLLVNPDLKRPVWDDVKKIMALLRIPLS